MSISRKYGRTYHYDFSEGTTSDDRINKNWREDVKKFPTILHTEKLDGENACLNEYGVFARSHAAPTIHPWADYLKPIQSMLKNDLKDNNLEIFGENLYAIHSIIYPKIDSHFYVFGIRCLDKWLSWEEVCWHSNLFNLKTVPQLSVQSTNDTNLIKETVVNLTLQPSVFGSLQNNYGRSENVDCTKEGVVSRNIDEYDVDDFSSNVFKIVRKNHVQTDTHWTKHIQRAKLINEY